LIERRAGGLTTDEAIRHARAVLDSTDTLARLRLCDQVAAHLALLNNPECPQPVKRMEAELRDLMLRLARDGNGSVHTWAR
jgi:hypothetical protein